MQYHIARNGQQAGTFSEDEVRARLQSNEFSPADLCWTEGMTDWQPLGVRFADAMSQPSGTALNPYAPPQVAIVSERPASGLQLASHGDRLLAALLNVVFVILCLVPTTVLWVSHSGSMTDQVISQGVIVGVACLTTYVIYNAYLLSVRGQSLPKKIMGIRIVTHPDSDMPGAGKAFWMRGALNFVIANCVPLYGLVDLCFIFREDRRCIHDLIAGTQVVKGQPPGY